MTPRGPRLAVLATIGIVATSALCVTESQAAPHHVAKAHLVVINQGVAGVRLGDTAARVKRLLGAPDRKSPHCGGVASAERSRGCLVWKYKKAKREIAIGHDKVVYFVLGSPKDMTATGIGFGAPRATVDQAYPDCPSDHAYCILDGRGTTSYPTSRKHMTLVVFNGEGGTISRFVIATYGSKYLGCVFGCG